MIGLVVFAVIGQFVKMWYAYDATMQRLEDERRVGATAGASGRTRAEEGSAA
jgi:hypothetical protein